MADIIYDRLSGLPPEQLTRLKDMGDGTFAPQAMSLSGLVPVQSLSAVSATGPGVVLDNEGVRNNHNLVVVTGAGVSAGTVILQGSQDGVNWFPFPTTPVSISTVAANAIYAPAAPNLYPVRYLRANITVAITGGTISAWVASAG
jgi:hypothetical protein